MIYCRQELAGVHHTYAQMIIVALSEGHSPLRRGSGLGTRLMVIGTKNTSDSSDGSHHAINFVAIASQSMPL